MKSYPIDEAPRLLREARAMVGLTQRQVAERMKISQQAYAKLEADDANLGVKTLERAIRAMGFQPVITMDDVGGMPVPTCPACGEANHEHLFLRGTKQAYHARCEPRPEPARRPAAPDPAIDFTIDLLPEGDPMSTWIPPINPRSGRAPRGPQEQAVYTGAEALRRYHLDPGGVVPMMAQGLYELLIILGGTDRNLAMLARDVTDKEPELAAWAPPTDGPHAPDPNDPYLLLRTCPGCHHHLDPREHGYGDNARRPWHQGCWLTRCHLRAAEKLQAEGTLAEQVYKLHVADQSALVEGLMRAWRQTPEDDRRAAEAAGAALMNVSWPIYKPHMASIEAAIDTLARYWKADADEAEPDGVALALYNLLSVLSLKNSAVEDALHARIKNVPSGYHDGAHVGVLIDPAMVPPGDELKLLGGDTGKPTAEG